MENREAVLTDYFKLRILLNRTNSNRDQKTEIVFDIVKKGGFDFSLIATLKGVKNPKQIELCRKRTNDYWKISEYSGLFSLEEFCANYLKRKLGSKISSEEIRIAVDGLQNYLRNLGISR